jgi:hypothetical protein
MKLISERFAESEEVLCPCQKCLNPLAKPKSHIEDHLYIHGIAAHTLLGYIIGRHNWML